MRNEGAHLSMLPCVTMTTSGSPSLAASSTTSQRHNKDLNSVSYSSGCMLCRTHSVYFWLYTASARAVLCKLNQNTLDLARDGTAASGPPCHL